MKTAAKIALLATLASCGPKPSGEPDCTTPFLGWRIFGSYPSASCEDFGRVELAALAAARDLEEEDSEAKSAVTSLVGIDVFLEAELLSCNEDRTQCIAGLSFCPTHSIQVTQAPVNYSALLHETVHIWQGCTGDWSKAGSAYPGFGGWTTPGHEGWKEHGIFDAIERWRKVL